MFFRQPKSVLTVPQAIKIGKWCVLYAPFIFIVIALRVAYVMTKNVNGFVIFLCFLSIISLALLYWSIAVMRWRIWAFSNVADILWLHGRAQIEHILPTNHFFMRLEYQMRTTAQKEFWYDMNKRLAVGQTPKSTLEDYELPKETVIFESKWQFWWIPLVSVVILGGIYFGINRLLFPTEKNIESKAFFVLIPAMVLFIRKEWWRGVKMVFSKQEPQITLNNKGIEIKDLSPRKWSEVSEIAINSRGYGEERKDTIELQYLTGENGFYREYFDTWADDDGNEFAYEYPDTEDIDEATYEANKSDPSYYKHPLSISFTKDIQNLNVSPVRLEYLIKIYQARANSNRRITILA